MAKTLPFTGSGVAIVTPFDGLKTNYETLGDLIEYHIENKTDAIIICGTTGEASTMPDEEHLSLIHILGFNTDGTAFISDMKIFITLTTPDGALFDIECLNKYRQPYVMYMLSLIHI